MTGAGTLTLLVLAGLMLASGCPMASAQVALDSTGAAPAAADSITDWLGEGPDSTADSAAPVAPPKKSDRLEHLVPELAGNPYKLEPGVRPYQNRLSLSPAFGELGARRLFTFRVAYNPNSWLGYEASLDHNPGQSVHAVINSISAILRHPWPGRVQPYVMGGYGMIVVYPGQALKADPVTKNALSYGAGTELFVRSDLAVRGEVKGATVMGRQTNGVGTAAYDYLQWTIGLSFYRSIKP
ncbi:MAG TPA: outer membrane beta-barrel protein [Candidatus Sulfotelmatobacter sp.]|nr:outer membrane beta-barrel protein [Candidatus Sulfotelmatobacter sp.]